MFKNISMENGALPWTELSKEVLHSNFQTSDQIQKQDIAFSFMV